ncbi:hypothetical protein [Sulfitobacter sp. 915]|uniref:hypothetical protein n=1 Tax=Sulfitobacter sp. 915 TaxID=3368558 RepID=UPI003744D8FB
MAQICDRLGEGQVVNIDLDPERSDKSHNHQFAFVRTAWMNLPEYHLGTTYAVSTTTLRKYALIQTGHCKTSMIAVGNNDRAERVAAFIDDLARDKHEFAVTSVSGSVVSCHTPLSQSKAAMGGEVFQRSKQDILEYLADMIGVTADELAKMGKKGET